MFSDFRLRLALWLSPEFQKRLDEAVGYAEQLREKDQLITETVNQRVADIITQMDPFEPLMRKYHGVFSKQYTRPEDKLDEPSRIRLFMWAYGMENDASFKHLTDWIANTQGNATIRKASNDHEWFYGRASLAVILLFLEEVSRLASYYKAILAKRNREFDESSVV